MSVGPLTAWPPPALGEGPEGLLHTFPQAAQIKRTSQVVVQYEKLISLSCSLQALLLGLGISHLYDTNSSIPRLPQAPHMLPLWLMIAVGMAGPLSESGILAPNGESAEMPE